MVELNIYLSIPMNSVIVVFWLLLMSFGLWLAFLALQANQPQKRYTTRSKSVHKQKSQSRIPRTGNWRQLLTLVQGDAAAADRLVKYEQNRNPDRSVDWCVEKAIWQLQRDRH
jgi:hypothetical protein